MTDVYNAIKKYNELRDSKEKVEYHFGKNYRYVVAPLHPKFCVHPVYQWGQAVDLKVDPKPLINLNFLTKGFAISEKTVVTFFPSSSSFV